MWAIEHEGLTGVTFDSDGHRLVGVLYLTRGEGADHAFSWHREELADLVVGWLRGLTG
jgi:hypothetical protein